MKPIFEKSFKIHIKPFSVNLRIGVQAKKNRVAYAAWKATINELLPPADELGLEKSDKFSIAITFGVSKKFDLDNCLKTTIDALEKKYGQMTKKDDFTFSNDAQIYAICARKKIVEQGEEFIHFGFIPFDFFKSIETKPVVEIDEQGRTIADPTL